MFQSAPLAEARGDNKSSPKPSPRWSFQSAPLAEARGDFAHWVMLSPPVPSIYSSASPWVGSQPCGAKYPGFCADSKGV